MVTAAGRDRRTRSTDMRGATDFAGARVCRAEPGIMWAMAVCRLAGAGMVTGEQDGPAGLLGAAIGAIGEGQERVGVARHAGECSFGSFCVSGHGRADGRAEAGRRW